MRACGTRSVIATGCAWQRYMAELLLNALKATTGPVRPSARNTLNSAPRGFGQIEAAILSRGVACGH
jgi:hypothetical protein